MGFLDSLEKLINEHGSAVILKERISLLNDRHADTERKLKDAEADRDRLRLENERLGAQNQTLQAQIDEVRRLQNEADRQRQQDLAGADRLPVEREAVLRLVCFHPGQDANQLAGLAGLGVQIAQFHLDELRAAKFIDVSYTMATRFSAGSTEWHIKPAGRKYLADNGLLSE